MENKMSNKNPNKVGDKQRYEQISKIVILCIVGCMIMGVMLALYKEMVPSALAEYEEQGKMEHTAWLVKYASLLPPVILLAIAVTVAYPRSSYVPVRTQYDKAIVVGVIFAFTYVVIMGAMLLSSPGWNLPTPETEEEVKTAFEICAPWFVAQVVPFIILLSYHLVRASSEKKELCENED
jgi:hypothetical protein